MKILLDENVDQRLSEFLESEGYKVSTVPEEDLGAANDTRIVEYCLKNNLAVLTHDDDFLSLASEKEEHPTIIHLPQRIRFREMKRRIENLRKDISTTNQEIYP